MTSPVTTPDARRLSRSGRRARGRAGRARDRARRVRGTAAASTRRPTRSPRPSSRSPPRWRTAAWSPAPTGDDVGALVLDPDGSTLWLRRVGVLPEVREHGVATALVTEALAEAEGYDDVAVLAREELPGTVRVLARARVRPRPAGTRRTSSCGGPPPRRTTPPTPSRCGPSAPSLASRAAGRRRRGALRRAGRRQDHADAGARRRAGGPRRRDLADVRDRAGAPVARPTGPPWCTSTPTASAGSPSSTTSTSTPRSTTPSPWSSGARASPRAWPTTGSRYGSSARSPTSSRRPSSTRAGCGSRRSVAAGSAYRLSVAHDLSRPSRLRQEQDVGRARPRGRGATRRPRRRAG